MTAPSINPLIAKVVLVTDPMCSWCWGMADEFETVRNQLKGRVEVDFILGGINTHGTQPIGDYGRRYLMKLWQEVHATTGQTFGEKLPEVYVHNSSLPCLVVEAVRDSSNEDALTFLRQLQYRFFVQGENVNDHDVLCEAATSFGLTESEFEQRIANSTYRARVQFQFDNATRFGTNALPSVLVEKDGYLQLLAGGFVDAQMLCELLAL